MPARESTSKIPKTIRTFFKFMLLLFVLFLVLNSVFYRMYLSDARTIIVEKDALRNESLASTIDFVLSEVERSTEQLVSNTLFFETLSARRLERKLDYEADARLLTFLKDLARTAESVESVLLHDRRTGNYYSTSYGILSATEIAGRADFDEAADLVSVPVWSHFPRLPGNPFLSEPSDALAYTLSLRSPDGIEPMGFLAVYLDVSVLDRLFRDVPAEQSRIIDREWNTIYATNEATMSGLEGLQNNLELDETIGGRMQFPVERLIREGAVYHNYIVSRLSPSNWYLANVSSVNLSETFMVRSGRIVILVTALNVLAFLAFILGYSRQALYPVTQLTGFMERVADGDFSARLEEKRRDEYGYIFARFNTMVRDLERLFNQVYKDQLLQKELKLILLRAKINPHFIYNIFENMRWMTELGKYEQLKETLVATAEYYRRTFRDDREEIPLGDAAGQIAEYVALQQIRFRSRLSAEFAIPEACRSLQIPNFCLQPVVENAIVHGIEPKVGPGTVRIEAHCEHGALTVRVRDDGVGLPEERLITLRREIQSSGDSNPGALSTIHQRLRLLYDDSGGLAIRSEPGVGTTVALRFSFGERATLAPPGSGQ